MTILEAMENEHEFAAGNAADGMKDTSLDAQLVAASAATTASDWESVYQHCPSALPSQSYSWMKAILRSGAWKNASRVYRFADGQQAFLPALSTRSIVPALARIYSPPSGWGFGGVICEKPLEAAHISAILSDAAQLPGLIKHIRPNPLDAAIWDAAAPPQWLRIPRVAHVLSLEGGYDKVSKTRFRPNVRNNIRQAERDIIVKCGNDEFMMRELHAMLMHSVARWAKRQHEPLALARWRKRRIDPLEKFLFMLAEAGPLLQIYTAYVEGKAAASILVLRDKNAHYTRGAMVEELAGRTHANVLLQARAIEDACNAGCVHYHMGETGNNAKLAMFKTRFGAEPVAYNEFRLERVPFTPAVKAAKSIIKKVIGFKDA